MIRYYNRKNIGLTNILASHDIMPSILTWLLVIEEKRKMAEGRDLKNP